MLSRKRRESTSLVQIAELRFFTDTASSMAYNAIAAKRAIACSMGIRNAARSFAPEGLLARFFGARPPTVLACMGIRIFDGAIAS